MELRNLKTFITVASLENFTRAGEELGYSQSNVSMQIKQLEDELGLQLFDRIGKYAYLSEYGKSLLPYARQIVSASEQMIYVSKSTADMEGTIRVGMTDSLRELLTESALISFHKRFPKVRLDLCTDPVAMITDQLKHGQLDTACIIHDKMPSSEWLVWYSAMAPIVLVANPNNPLASKSVVTAEDIADQPIILMEASAPYSIAFSDYLEHRGFECSPVMRMDSPAASCRLVLQDESLMAVIPRYSAQHLADKGKLKILNLEGWNHSQAVQMLLHKHKVLTPQIEGFLTELKDALETVMSKGNEEE